MENTQIIPVILCGGSGTRLWPLSRRSYPKQFVPLVGEKSLLELTIERLTPFNSPIVAVAAEPHQFLVSEAFQRTAQLYDIILEPHSRNTAAAMALAAIHCQGLLLFCPADHHIADTDAFIETVKTGVDAALNGSIVTFGIVPSFPNTAYGYIQRGQQATEHCYKVQRFIEKPNRKAAEELLLKGDALWNAGIFLCKADVLIGAMEQLAPDILAACRTAMQKATQETPEKGHNLIRPDASPLSDCRSQSIDYAVMEHFHNVSVIPYSGQWSDVGSWNAVADLIPADADGNRIHGKGVSLYAKNTFIHADHRPVVAIGTEQLLIIDTPDATLVAHCDYVEKVKDVVDILEKAQYPQAITHRKVARPWGWYDSISKANRFQVKRIGVKPGASLSLQMHHHRAEHWVVVKGTAEVTCGDDTFLLSENQSTYIPIGKLHRLRNPGKVELEIIEIQSGSYLEEDDIVRVEDTYGRALPQ
ncbi:mannose-1-phosphate guanylyltransferase/mannose-6-phosphate isomerase [Paludibacterium purpuratum]|uniref:mannose-1-phosphate guanylyltransferase n=1 Tax=Paludibacterium purpuratum TaxID=1144873 RepID=A0A4R7B423_9NEIS|nr:mannose-1-phosphate guanylyltransferase/mannose-6-phosphate isomerase [Paludibacterium purpuratum]TDR76735.1 mannose-1-phosphate guanylyltransferase (GDP) /mannose-6-phosphate isomerase type 2 [Paludibacterium purpuratum]